MPTTIERIKRLRAKRKVQLEKERSRQGEKEGGSKGSKEADDGFDLKKRKFHFCVFLQSHFQSS